MTSRRTHARDLISVVCALALAGCATAEVTSRRMLDLNREALAAYQEGHLAQARDLLLQAVTLGKESGLTKDNTMARTYLDLGAVYLAMKERDKGLRQLGLALRIEPDIEPTTPVATPPVKKALASARAELKRRRGQNAKEPDEESAPAKPEPAEPHAIVKAKPAPEKAVTKTEKPAPKVALVAPVKPETAKAELAGSEPAKPAPEKLAPAPVVAQASPDDEEPDLPATVPQPIYCPTPDEAPPAEDIALRCVPRPGTSVGKMVLFYRSAGKEEFTSVPMIRSHKGWYSGLVPASAVVGKSLQYYVEAQASNRKAATSNGQADSPNLVSIRAGAAPVGRGTLAAAHFKSAVPGAKDEDPLLEAERAREHEETVSADHRRRPHAIFVGLGVGTGWGWHARRVLEFRSEDAVAAGFSPAGLLQLTPEIGYQYDARTAFSLQTRHQFIPESGSGDTKAGHPAHSAFAVLARAYRFYGEGNGQLFLTGTVGAGDGFRLVVPPRPTDFGSGVPSLDRNDTIRGGPVVLGPGAGFVYHFTPHVGWLAEVRALAGVPDFAVLGEFSTGVQGGF